MLPDTPTLAEAGLKGFDADQWFVVATTAGTPPERITALNAAITKSLQDPEVLAAFAAAGVTVSPATAHQTTEFVAKDVARWQELAKKANLTLDQ